MAYNTTRNQTAFNKANETKEETVTLSPTEKLIEETKPKNKIPVTVKPMGCTVSKPLHARMKAYSKANGVKMAFIVKSALKEWLELDNKDIEVASDIHSDLGKIQKFSCVIPIGTARNLKSTAAQLDLAMSICTEDAVIKYLRKKEE